MTSRLLLLGGPRDAASQALGAAVSPAASRWQRGLLGGLNRAGAEVTVLGYRPEPVFPRGPLLVRGGASDVGYANLPYVRNTLIGAGMARRIDLLVAQGARPRALLSYNAAPAYAAAARAARERHGIPWFPLVADVIHSSAKQERWLEGAAGRVYLSWQWFQDGPGPKLHLDGGVEALPPEPRSAPQPAVLFSGAIGPYTGVERLAQAFALIPGDHVELWICGKGRSEKVEAAAAADRRIKLLGFVNEERLQDLTNRAAVLVNPRPTDQWANEFNFPSKVLEYLASGKPVVSTWTDGLAPEYREVLMVAEDAEPETLAARVGEALALGESERAAVRERARRFLVERRRLWSDQATRLLAFLDAEIAVERAA